MIGNNMGKFYAYSIYLHLIWFHVINVTVRFIFSFFTVVMQKNSSNN